MTHVLLDVTRAVPAWLAQHHPVSHLVLTFVLPWTCVRSLATFGSGILSHTPLPAFIVAIGAWAMQIGLWLLLSLSLPVIARALRWPLKERDAMVLCAITCAPMWAAGVLFVVPDEPQWAYYLTRSLVFVAALYGARLLWRTLTTLRLPLNVAIPMVTGTMAAYGLLYAVLFATVGLGANVVLWLLPVGSD